MPSTTRRLGKAISGGKERRRLDPSGRDPGHGPAHIGWNGSDSGGKIRRNDTQGHIQNMRDRSIADSPAERLSRFMASTAIFFLGNSDDFVGDEQAEQQVQELAGLLASNDLRI